MKHVLIDTNVFLSALITPGSSRKVLNFWAENKFQLYISSSIIEEISIVGKRRSFRKYFTLSQLKNLLILIKTNAQIVKSESTIPPEYNSTDPKDNIFIAVIVSKKIDYFITGNHRHFTSIKNRTTVCSPTEFLNVFNL